MRSLRTSVAAVGLSLATATIAGCKADIGDPCMSADDCEFGLVCISMPDAGPTACQLPQRPADMIQAAQSDMGSSDGGG